MSFIFLFKKPPANSWRFFNIFRETTRIQNTINFKTNENNFII